MPDVNNCTSLVAQLEAANAGKQSRQPGASKLPKRKAEKEAPTDSESEDAFGTMDVDRNNASTNKDANAQDDVTESEGEERQSTPEPLEDETASEDEEGETAGPPPQPPRNKKSSEAPARDEGGSSEPPPRRELPFARRGGKDKAAPAAQELEKPGNGDSTDSDDEL